ncbi:hypothetical protein Bca101_066730 [Brassica carinata]
MNQIMHIVKQITLLKVDYIAEIEITRNTGEDDCYDEAEQVKVGGDCTAAMTKLSKSKSWDFALRGYRSGTWLPKGIIIFRSSNSNQVVAVEMSVVFLHASNQCYAQDLIRTSDMVRGQETTQTNKVSVSEQPVAKPSLESLPENERDANTSKKKASQILPQASRQTSEV